jgi:hypothetical protein
MKITRRLMIGAAVFILASCIFWNGATPQPTPVKPGTNPDATNSVATGSLAISRPTLPSVEALSTLIPAFDGLYWSSDLLVEKHGDTTARVLAGMPCAQVLALLSSGDWLLTRQLPKNEQTGGTIPELALMERNGEFLFLKIRDIVSASSSASVGGQTPPAAQTPDLAPSSFDPNNISGCQILIAKIVPQSIEAHGTEELQGTALGYPLLMDCLYSTNDVTVSVFYEGAGDFRALLQFDTPNTIGEHPVSQNGLSLNVYRTPLNVMEFMSLASTEEGNSSSDTTNTTYDAGSDTPGKVTIQAVNPLTGEIQLDDLVDESGNPQTFKAGFQCGW